MNNVYELSSGINLIYNEELKSKIEHNIEIKDILEEFIEFMEKEEKEIEQN